MMHNNINKKRKNTVSILLVMAAIMLLTLPACSPTDDAAQTQEPADVKIDAFPDPTGKLLFAGKPEEGNPFDIFQ